MATLRAFEDRSQMDFIEKSLGFSPDQSDRSLEVLLLIALVAMITVLGWQFFHRLRDQINRVWLLAPSAALAQRMSAFGPKQT